MSNLNLSNINISNPLSKPAVLNSRAFQSGILGVFVTFIIFYFPELEPYRESLPEIIKVVTLGLIVRFTYSNQDGGTNEG